MTEQWVTMRVAAKALGVSTSKITRLAKNGVIQAQKDALDKRVRLVDLTELKALYARSRLQKREETSAHD